MIDSIDAFAEECRKAQAAGVDIEGLVRYARARDGALAHKCPEHVATILRLILSGKTGNEAVRELKEFTRMEAEAMRRAMTPEQRDEHHDRLRVSCYGD